MLSVGRINRKPKTGGSTIPYLQRQTCELPWRPPRGENIKNNRIITRSLAPPLYHRYVLPTDRRCPIFLPLTFNQAPVPGRVSQEKSRVDIWSVALRMRNPPITFLCSANAFGRLTFCTALRYHWPGWLLLVCYDYTPLLAYIVADYFWSGPNSFLPRATRSMVLSAVHPVLIPVGYNICTPTSMRVRSYPYTAFPAQAYSHQLTITRA